MLAQHYNNIIQAQGTFLSYVIKEDCVRLKMEQNVSNIILTSWYCLNLTGSTPNDIQDEASLGLLMSTNAWHLSGHITAPGCQLLNVCELGYNRQRRNMEVYIVIDAKER